MRKRPEVGGQSTESRIIILGIARHLRARILRQRITNVGGEISGRRRRECGERFPRTARLLSAFAPRVMATEAILLCDAEAGLHFALARLRPARSDSAKDNFLLAELDPHNAPRNLRFIHMRENLKAGCEMWMRNHVWSHIKGMLLSILWPASRWLAVHVEDQQRVVRRHVHVRIAGAIAVVANRDDHVRRGIRAKKMLQVFELHTADLGWAREVRVVRYSKGNLRHSQKFIASDEARRFRRKARDHHGVVNVATKTIPWLAFVAMVLALVGNLYPTPEGPYGKLPYIYLGYLAVALLWFMLHSRSNGVARDES